MIEKIKSSENNEKPKELGFGVLKDTEGNYFYENKEIIPKKFSLSFINSQQNLVVPHYDSYDEKTDSIIVWDFILLETENESGKKIKFWIDESSEEEKIFSINQKPVIEIITSAKNEHADDRLTPIYGLFKGFSFFYLEVITEDNKHYIHTHKESMHNLPYEISGKFYNPNEKFYKKIQLINLKKDLEPRSNFLTKLELSKEEVMYFGSNILFDCRYIAPRQKSFYTESEYYNLEIMTTETLDNTILPIYKYTKEYKKLTPSKLNYLDKKTEDYLPKEKQTQSLEKTKLRHSYSSKVEDSLRPFFMKKLENTLSTLKEIMKEPNLNLYTSLEKLLTKKDIEGLPKIESLPLVYQITGILYEKLKEAIRVRPALLSLAFDILDVPKEKQPPEILAGIKMLMTAMYARNLPEDGKLNFGIWQKRFGYFSYRILIEQSKSLINESKELNENQKKICCEIFEYIIQENKKGLIYDQIIFNYSNKDLTFEEIITRDNNLTISRKNIQEFNEKETKNPVAFFCKQNQLDEQELQKLIEKSPTKKMSEFWTEDIQIKRASLINAVLYEFMPLIAWVIKNPSSEKINPINEDNFSLGETRSEIFKQNPEIKNLSLAYKYLGIIQQLMNDFVDPVANLEYKARNEKEPESITQTKSNVPFPDLHNGTVTFIIMKALQNSYRKNPHFESTFKKILDSKTNEQNNYHVNIEILKKLSKREPSPKSLFSTDIDLLFSEPENYQRASYYILKEKQLDIIDSLKETDAITQTYLKIIEIYNKFQQETESINKKIPNNKYVKLLNNFGSIINSKYVKIYEALFGIDL